MNRKKFLKGLVAGSGLLMTDQTSILATSVVKHKNVRVPPYLTPGDTIGITCPSGFMTESDVAPAIEQLERWGFKTVVGKTVGKRDFTFGGTDEERKKDFQEMIDNSQIKAILCARGGYGVVRMIDQLDFSVFKQQPKWIIGFSDITVFHSHLHTNFRVATIHSKMCNSFPKDWSQADPLQAETILSLRKALMGEQIQYPILPHPLNRLGEAEGQLIGGNLKMLETMAGTPSDIHTDGKILFVEVVGEALYNIDRMFCHLLRTGKLNKLKGLIIGGFTSIKIDTPEETFGRTVYEIVTEKVKQFSYPVCFDFPVGHQKNNFAIKCGMNHRLRVKETEVHLEEV